jgi:hypothetical protein
MGEVLDWLPDSLAPLLESRLSEDMALIATVTLDCETSTRYARKLLHRLSESLAFALMCEIAADANAHGDELPILSAVRYYEEIEPPKIGMENERVRKSAMALIDGAAEEGSISAGGTLG